MPKLVRLPKLDSSDTSVANEKMCNISNTIKELIKSFHATDLSISPGNIMFSWGIERGQ